MKGVFITMEGPDGAGKSTQIQKLQKYFISRGREILVTREPGGTSLGENLREILLTTQGEGPVPEAEALIYAASRAQLVKKVISPALLAGKLVLCDRFVDSSLAYQGWARNLGIEELTQINGWFLKDYWPDLTLVLDIDPEISLNRLKGSKDRLEREDLQFHKKVREGFLKIHQNNSKRVKIIDANQDVERVFKSILLEIQKSGIINIDKGI